MPDSETSVAHLKQKVSAFVNERDWEQYHDPKNLSMSIAIEAAELMELCKIGTADFDTYCAIQAQYCLPMEGFQGVAGGERRPQSP